MEAAKPAAEVRSLILLPGGLRISKWAFASALVALDALLVSFIIAYVPYTKIDWDAYMSQVDGFIEGERDYMKLKGDTGPLVYPAGFLYIYTALKFVTGGQAYLAQVLFGILYLINLAIVMFIYLKTDVLPCIAPDITTVMFAGNFLGIVCARSLQYQFYSWYFYSLPFLLWKVPFPNHLRLVLLAALELCWNIYPSNIYSSVLLFCIHLVILWVLWVARCE